MDDFVFPISDPCPVSLVNRSIRVAHILDSTAAEFGFVVQYGEIKTKLSLVLRGTRKSEAMDMLRRFERGTSGNRTVHLPLGHGKQVRVVRGYKHPGAMFEV